LPSSFGTAVLGSAVNFVSGGVANVNLKVLGVLFVVATAVFSGASSCLWNENVVVRLVVDVTDVDVVAGDEPNEKPVDGVDPNENPVEGAPKAAATAGEAVVFEETKKDFNKIFKIYFNLRTYQL
jgi:hypothetical protein